MLSADQLRRLEEYKRQREAEAWNAALDVVNGDGDAPEVEPTPQPVQLPKRDPRHRTVTCQQFAMVVAAHQREGRVGHVRARP